MNKEQKNILRNLKEFKNIIWKSNSNDELVQITEKIKLFVINTETIKTELPNGNIINNENLKTEILKILDFESINLKNNEYSNLLNSKFGISSILPLIMGLFTTIENY